MNTIALIIAFALGAIAMGIGVLIGDAWDNRKRYRRNRRGNKK